MHAVVLVGGFGTRLRPLTNTIPKPMLPVGHRPMIARLIEGLAAGGVDEVVLALGFRPEPFVEAFPDGRLGDVRLRYAVEPEPLDTAGAVRFAALDAGVDDTFVVANGDVMTDLDVAALVDAHRGFGAEATLHLTGVDDPSAFGVVDVEPSGRVARFVEKPAPGTAPSNLVNAGTYVFEPSVLDRIDGGRPVSVERETFPAICADGRLYAVPTDDYWIDAGRPELYRSANLDLVNGRRALSCDARAPDAVVDPSASIEGSLVGAGAAVGARASLSGSVILPGAVVGEGAQVRDSIVMGTIGAAAVVTACTVGAEGAVAATDVCEDQRIPPVE